MKKRKVLLNVGPAEFEPTIGNAQISPQIDVGPAEVYKHLMLSPEIGPAAVDPQDVTPLLGKPVSNAARWDYAPPTPDDEMLYRSIFDVLGLGRRS